MIPARSFYLIRHGETVMNALKLCCGGGVDTELNEEGRKQAAEAALTIEALAEKPTLIINSGMSRTRETTAIINKNTKIPVIEDHDLREHMLGEWEGQPWDTIVPKLRTDAKPEGGESGHEYAMRIKTALNRHLGQHEGERLLFVTHGGTFHSLLRLYDHGQDKVLFIPNATLHHFQPEPAHTPMPWRVNVLHWVGRVKTSPAAICPSQVNT
jgi:probable phosphoglycerate mutase